MIEHAEVAYQADDEVLLLSLEDDAMVHAKERNFFLSATAYKQLRRSILSLECEICGGNHPDFFHGSAPILSLDTQHDTPEGDMRTQIIELKHLFDNEGERQFYHRMEELHEQFLSDCNMGEEGLDYEHYTRGMEQVAADAGYVIVNNSDAGAWMVYATFSDEEDM